MKSRIPLSNDIRLLLVRDLETMSREIDLFPDDASIWTAPPGISNPAGTLAQHICGNLQHYVGHILGGTDYVRDRPAEFVDRTASRADIRREIQITIDVIERVVPALSEEMLDGAFPEAVGGIVPGTRLFLIHLCTHAAHHAGQAGYLRRMITGDPTSSGAVSVRALGSG